MSNFDWRGYFELAGELFEGRPVSNQEAKCRTVISRAYYAALLVAREYVEDPQWGLGYRIDNDRVHREVPARIEQEGKEKGDTDLIGIADLLVELKKRRRDADYEPWYKRGRANVKDEAENSIEQAGDVITKIDAIKTAKTNPGSQAP